MDKKLVTKGRIAMHTNFILHTKQYVSVITKLLTVTQSSKPKP